MKNNGISKFVLLSVFLFLVGCLVLAGLLRFIDWPIVLFIVKSNLIVLPFGTIGGMVTTNFIGRKKGFRSNLFGIVALIVLSLGFMTISYLYLSDTKLPIGSFEESIREALFFMSIWISSEFGRDIACHR